MVCLGEGGGSLPHHLDPLPYVLVEVAHDTVGHVVDVTVVSAVTLMLLVVVIVLQVVPAVILMLRLPAVVVFVAPAAMAVN